LIDLMKPMSKSQNHSGPILAFGAHPDDIEFGCGGVIALETRAGNAAHFVICSRGEAGTNGSLEERTVEAANAAKILGATHEFVDLDGDGHLEVKSAHVIKLAGIIRRIRPGVVLAPSLVGNQHPDHGRLGQMVRDAARLARYGGLAELKEIPTHSITQLFYYAIAASEPCDITPVLMDVSAPEIVQAWTESMEAHATQSRTRNYAELQLVRARALGGQAGVQYAIALYPNDPIVVRTLAGISQGARHF
jgi:LmbE family N-acetylglucosaminyl deacetylase